MLIRFVLEATWGHPQKRKKDGGTTTFAPNRLGSSLRRRTNSRRVCKRGCTQISLETPPSDSTIDGRRLLSGSSATGPAISTASGGPVASPDFRRRPCSFESIRSFIDGDVQSTSLDPAVPNLRIRPPLGLIAICPPFFFASRAYPPANVSSGRPN